MTHEWSGVGGCLEINDDTAKAKYRGNTWSPWNETTPRHRAFIDAILRHPAHVIVTMRSKTETAQVEENNRKKVVKLGMKSEQRDGLEYEFTTVLDIVHDGNFAVASKDRTELFKSPEVISEKTGERLVAWLDSGKDMSVIDDKELSEAIDAINESIEISQAQGIFGAVWRRVNDEQKATLKSAYDAKKQALEQESAAQN